MTTYLQPQLSKFPCTACQLVRNEKAAQIAREKEEEAKQILQKAKQILQKHKVHFYDYIGAVPKVEFSETGPEELRQVEGAYDILFHHGFDMGDHVENRTTKGTVVLRTEDNKNDDDNDDDEEEMAKGTFVMNGQVTFLEELRLSEHMAFQRDYKLSKGHQFKHQGKWCCTFDTRLVDPEAYDIIQADMDTPPKSYLMRVENRCAMAWMKQERNDDREEEEEEFEAPFKTLEEAVALTSEQIKEGEPPKAFFLEPGDFILSTEWSDDFRECFYTDIILRRQKD